MQTLFLAPYFEKQRELDEFILKKFNLEENQELLEKRIVAFQVELMECCNSWRGFKYWTENPEPKEDLLEEYVDGMHFILSIGNLIGEAEDTFPLFPSGPHVAEVEPIMLFCLTADLACKMHHDNHYSHLVMVFFDLGYSLGFTWDQITEAYNKKYEVNIQRMNNGY